MKHSLFLHWQSARRALAGFVRQPLGSFLNLVLLAVALSLPLGLYVTVKGIGDWSGKLAATPQITLFMETSADATDLEAVATALKQHPSVKATRFVSRKQALEQLIEHNGLGDLRASLGENPLPDAYIVEPADSLIPAQTERLEKELSGLPMVETAQFDAGWAKKLYSLIDLGRQLVWLLGITFALALVLVTHNTIRLQVLARRDEIEVSKLIGATDGFIRRPFLYHALWQGVFAALAAWGLNSWFVSSANPAIGQLARLYNEQAQLSLLGPLEVATLVAGAALLSMFGARLAADHHLRALLPR